MATGLEIQIEHKNIDDIISFFKKELEVVQIEYYKRKDTMKFDFYGDKRTFIVHQESNRDWVQIEYEVEDPLELDNILLHLSEHLSTRIIYYYRQTTSDEVRFCLLNQGKLVRSIYQKSDEKSNLILAENIGPQFEFEESRFNEKDLNENIEIDLQLSSYDECYPWFQNLGFEWKDDSSSYFEYCHLEVSTESLKKLSTTKPKVH